MIEGLNLSEVPHYDTLAKTGRIVPTIKVIGIGKCGIDAVNYMIEHGVEAAEYVAIDTDAQALACCQAYDKVQISDWFLPNDSSTAALEKAAEQETIKNLIGDSNIVFIVLAMGENTGWHFAPMIAKIVPPMEKLILAAVVMPLAAHEKHVDCTDENFNQLADNVDALIVIPDYFDDTKISLPLAITGIAELYRDDGLLPFDLLDAAIDFLGAGICLMGTASASGTDRAKIAADSAIAHLTRQNVDTSSARRKAIVNITSSSSLQPEEVVTIMQCIKLSADVRQSLISAGTAVDETMGDELRVTVFEFTPDDQNVTWGAILNQLNQKMGE